MEILLTPQEKVREGLRLFQEGRQLESEQSRASVISMLTEFKHFKSLMREENYFDYFTKALPFFKYQRVKQGDFVFHHSDRGGIFYFILSGHAGVFVPKSDEALKREWQLTVQISRTAAAISKSQSPDEINYFQRIRKQAIDTLATIRHLPSEAYLLNHPERYIKSDGNHSISTFNRIAQLSSTDAFGEVSIVTNKKLRTASIVAIAKEQEADQSTLDSSSPPILLLTQPPVSPPIEDASDGDLHLLMISGEHYIHIFDQELNRLNFTLRVLEETFPLASREAVIRIAYEFKETTYDKGQVIFREGEPATKLCLVKFGEIELVNKLKTKAATTVVKHKKASPQLMKFEEDPTSISGEAVVGILGPEAFFGYEDAHTYLFTARNLSSNAIMLSIDLKFIVDLDLLSMVRSKINEKRCFFQERIHKLSLFAAALKLEKRMPRKINIQEIVDSHRPPNNSQKDHQTHTRSTTYLPFIDLSAVNPSSFARSYNSNNTEVLATAAAPASQDNILEHINDRSKDTSPFTTIDTPSKLTTLANTFRQEKQKIHPPPPPLEHRQRHIREEYQMQKKKKSPSPVKLSSFRRSPHPHHSSATSRNTSLELTSNSNELKNARRSIAKLDESFNLRDSPKKSTDSRGLFLNSSGSRGGRSSSSSKDKYNLSPSDSNKKKLQVLDLEMKEKQPRLQFKRVIKDFLDAKKAAEVLTYFWKPLTEEGGALTTAATTSSGNHFNKHSSSPSPPQRRPARRIGRETGEVAESERDRLEAISSYNQQLLDTKHEEQNNRMKEYNIEQDLILAKAKKITAIRTIRTNYFDYLHNPSSSSRSPAEYLRRKSREAYAQQPLLTKPHNNLGDLSLLDLTNSYLPPTSFPHIMISSPHLPNKQTDDEEDGKSQSPQPATARLTFDENEYEVEQSRHLLFELASKHIRELRQNPLLRRRSPNFKGMQTNIKAHQETLPNNQLAKESVTLLQKLKSQSPLPAIHSSNKIII